MWSIPQLFQLLHFYLGIASWENKASSCFGCVVVQPLFFRPNGLVKACLLGTYGAQKVTWRWYFFFISRVRLTILHAPVTNLHMWLTIMHEIVSCTYEIVSHLCVRCSGTLAQIIEWSGHCGVNSTMMGCWNHDQVPFTLTNLYYIVPSSSVVSYIVAVLLHSDLSTYSALLYIIT